MLEKVDEIRKAALQACSQASSVKDLEQARVRFLGKKGELTLLLRSTGQLPPEERPGFGRLVNELRDELEAVWAEREEQLFQEEEERRLMAETLDITLPGRAVARGGVHPITRIIEDTKAIFMQLGYEVVEGPEVELDYYNFEALNIPPDHPARDMQDTFFINERLLLRSQTSPVQIRVMENRKPPIRILAPGKVYRADSDITHSPMFHQIEGLVVDRGITFADLKAPWSCLPAHVRSSHQRSACGPVLPLTEPAPRWKFPASCAAERLSGVQRQRWRDPRVCMVDSRVLAG